MLRSGIGRPWHCSGPWLVGSKGCINQDEDHEPISNVTAVLLALVVGCATGVAVDDLIVPARAAPGTSYQYQVIDVQASFGMTGGSADKQAEALNRYGPRAGKLLVR
jgi:hypothetical protein